MDLTYFTQLCNESEINGHSCRKISYPEAQELLEELERSRVELDRRTMAIAIRSRNIGFRQGMNAAPNPFYR